MKPETGEWLMMSDSDLRMAGAGLELDEYAQCVFHSHQAVEKLLKAIWIECRTESHPWTHNLVDIAASLGLLAPEWEVFLRRLSNQAVASRYAGAEAYNRDVAMDYYRGALRLCEQLRQRLT